MFRLNSLSGKPIRVMRAQGLRGRIVRKWTKTTEADPKAVPAPNLLDRDFTALKANERWVGDVTYLRTPAGWCIWQQ